MIGIDDYGQIDPENHWLDLISFLICSLSLLTLWGLTGPYPSDATVKPSSCSSHDALKCELAGSGLGGLEPDSSVPFPLASSRSTFAAFCAGTRAGGSTTTTSPEAPFISVLGCPLDSVLALLACRGRRLEKTSPILSVLGVEFLFLDCDFPIRDRIQEGRLCGDLHRVL